MLLPELPSHRGERGEMARAGGRRSVENAAEGVGGNLLETVTMGRCSIGVGGERLNGAVGQGGRGRRGREGREEKALKDKRGERGTAN